MKTAIRILKLTILLCFTFAMTAAFGQTFTTLIWTNPIVTGPNGNNIGVSTNWSGPAGPGANWPVSGTTLEWNGTVPGPLVLYSDDGINHMGFPIGGDPGSLGVSFYINAAQTSPVTISTRMSPSSVAMGFTAFTIDSGAGQLTLGDTSNNSLLIVLRPGGATHDWVNNSTNPMIICPNIQWQNGGGAQCTMEFDSPLGTPGGGIGDFGITNSLRSSNNGSIALWFVSSGTITWYGGSIPNDNVSASATVPSPIFLNACTTLILKTNNLLTTQAIQNNNDFGFPSSPLIYDGNSPQTLSGVIGGGTSPKISISVWSGTLTLSGANVYIGDTTNKGGELVAGRAENAGVNGPFGLYHPGNPIGQQGLIHLNGGTLGWSLNNSYDYSSHFATTPDPIYNFDSGGANVTLGTGLAGATSTLTKTGSGSITLSGTSSYGGLTTISSGTLNFRGAKTGAGSITVNDGATLEVNGAVAAMTPTTLTLGQASDVILAYDNLNSTVNAPIQATTLSAPASSTVHIVINSGTFTVGQSYPLFSWTGVAPAPGTHLDSLTGYAGNLVTNGNTIKLAITATALTWTGNNNNSWDTSTPNNWQQNGGAVVFAGGFPTLFDDSTVNNLNITNKGLVAPLALTVNNNTNVYQITSSPGNAISGSTGLTKSGTNVLSLNGGANAYTGVTTLGGGTVIVSALANGGQASDIGASVSNATSLVFDGGTLRYTNNAVQIDRLFSVTGNGGTIDASGVGALQFTNLGALIMSGNLARTLTLTGNAVTNNTFAPVIVDSTGGATALMKNGAGQWILTGTNTYSGVTTVSNGTLQIGNGGASGSLGVGNTTLAINTTLLVNRTGNLTISGAINGGGAVTVQSGTVTLTAGNSYTGGTTVSNGATLNIGAGGANANLAAAAPVLNNGFMKFNSTTPITIRGFFANISGTGNFEIGGTGVVAFDGAKLYSGWTLIDAGATLQVSVGNETTGMSGPAITNNGTLYMQRQDYGVFIITNNIVGSGKLVKDVGGTNPGDVTLYGTNTYTGGTCIGSGELILGDGVTAGSGAIVGNVIFTNSSAGNDSFRELEFNRPDNFTFPDNILGATPTFSSAGNRGVVFQNGTGVLTLTGTNTYVDGTIVNNGVLQVGNGGTTGSIGNGTLTVCSKIVFNRSDAYTFSGNISDAYNSLDPYSYSRLWVTGMVVQAGSGTLTLSGTKMNMYDPDLGNYGSLTASNGTMVVSAASSVYGNVTVSGGAFTASAIGTVGTLTVSNNLTITSGILQVTVNKALSPAQSNSVYLVASNLTATGGTLKLVNYGPAFVPGDKFVIFRQVDGVTPKPVSGGLSMAVTAPGVTSFINNLAADGSVTVQTLSATPLAFSSAARSGANLNLTWPSDWTGMHLQSQTNTLAKGLGTNWVTISGTDAANGYTNTINTTNGSVFYRLAP